MITTTKFTNYNPPSPGRAKKIMKKIINGKKYDTNTAAYLFESYRGVGCWGELYRKDNGEFFVAHITQWEGQSDWIEPISESEAKELIGQEDGDMYELYFGEAEE